jgi:hypothetical protein
MNQSDCEDYLMRCADTVGDWLSAEMFGAETEPWRSQWSVSKIDFDDTKVSTLMCIAFDSGIDHTTRCLALSAVRERFLQTPEAREIVAQVMADEPDEDEKSRALAHYSKMADEAAR